MSSAHHRPPADDADGADGSDGSGAEPIGSVGEEAARLFGVLGDLAGHRDASGAGDGSGSAWSHLAAQAAEAVHGFEVPLANGAPECRWCPVCRVVHAVRESTSPEVRAHLGAAAASLVQAAAAFLEPPRPPDAPAAPDRPDQSPEESR